ncbi:hypothetical protein [Paraburkholderia youngii]|uniref:hypothetical protein n=1 Tax=Paraburkholderia youngii TaxID=2782701 RepID=UPI003D2541F7
MKPNNTKTRSAEAQQGATPADAGAVVWVFDTEANGECCPGITKLGDGTFRVVDVNAVEPDSMPAAPIANYVEAFGAALACRSAYLERAAHELHERRNWMFGCEAQSVH